jgi:two-component sensor histidine kinase
LAVGPEDGGREGGEPAAEKQIAPDDLALSEDLAASGDAERRSRVLYIDDDPGIARLVQRHLSRCGFSVATAQDGSSGLTQAAEERFDAIVIDHYMPGRDGLDLLGDLLALPYAAPVIFVTGAEEPRIAVAALKSGAADYVIKDVQGSFLELLASSIAQEITRARLQRERDDAEREVRESRDRLARLAAQQAVLLREVNHRVANSLQLISSLIELQARRVADEAARGMLRQAAERVEAVSLVHRRLYTSNDVEFVDLDAYLAGLIEELARATASSEPAIGPRIALSAESIRVETDKAVPIGLIVNELVTNAFKYAYPGEGAGEVRVLLARHVDGCAVLLVVEDDGIGYPEPDSAPKGSGMGAMIVNSMARSLGATVELDRTHPGTRFVVCMP